MRLNIIQTSTGLSLKEEFASDQFEEVSNYYNNTVVQLLGNGANKIGESEKIEDYIVTKFDIDIELRLHPH